MNKEKLARISELSKKNRSGGLTLEEQAEQTLLRREYIDAVKTNLRAQLDNIEVVDETPLS